MKKNKTKNTKRASDSNLTNKDVSRRGFLMLGAAGLGAAIAIAGLFVVVQSHKHYRSARNAALEIERELGLSDMHTTAGMRDSARVGAHRARIRIRDVVCTLLLAIMWLDCMLVIASFIR